MNCVIFLTIAVLLSVPMKEWKDYSVKEQYAAFQQSFENIDTYEEITENGYRIMEEQVFTEVFESFGEEPLTFRIAKDKKYNRIAVFLTNQNGEIVYKTHQLETNYQQMGMLRQSNKGVSAVSFIDVNHDNRKDIVLITKCRMSGENSGKYYKVGDVLFQSEAGFYRDYRISDKINRFGMNKSVRCIISFVRDEKSTEFLYTAIRLEELLEQGFDVIEEQCYARSFEKLGKLQVVPGTYSMGDYNVFMIYLVNERGDIVWSFQPMEDYDNLYSLRGISCKDMDGDGTKDIVVLAKYSYEESSGELVVKMDCSIYYQRTGGFDKDIEFCKQFSCEENMRMDALVQKIREYWGWQVEPEIITEDKEAKND